MHSSLSRIASVIVGLALCASALFAQTSGAPQRVTRADIETEQRIADKSYIELGEGDVKAAYDLIGSNNLTVAVGRAKDALVRLALAKRATFANAPRIQSATSNVFGFRISAAEKDKYLAQLKTIIERATKLEVSIENLIKALKDKGVDVTALSQAFTLAQQGNPSAVAGILRVQLTSFVAPGDPSLTSSTPTAPTVPTSYIDAKGVKYTQRPDGVWVEPPGILLPGWRIDPATGLLSGPNGERVDLTRVPPPFIDTSTQPPVIVDPSQNPSRIPTGPGPSGPVSWVGKDGKPIVIPPEFQPWDGKPKRAVRREYRGGLDGELTVETMVEARIGAVQGNSAVVEFYDIERRLWSLEIVPGEEKSSGNRFTRTYKLAGGYGFTVEKWIVTPSASTEAVPGSPNSQQISYDRNGQYTVRVTGKTEWGSAFSVEILETVAGLQ